MKHYTVEVWAYLPYERKFSYRIEASTYATAINRGVRNFRKEDGVRRKRIDKIAVGAIQHKLPNIPEVHLPELEE